MPTETAEFGVCSICGISKPICEYQIRKRFSKRKNKVDVTRRKDCFDCCKARSKKYRDANGSKLKISKKEYWEKNKHRFRDKRAEYDLIYRTAKIETKRKSAREWARRNRRKIIDRAIFRYKTEPQFNLRIKLRRRIWMALFKRRGGIVADTTIKLLGCSFSFFKKYFELKFKDGMTWNHVLSGEIHIDHIKPCSKFDLSKKGEQEKCFHYTNLQPLWGRDNLIKGAKYEK